MDSAIHIDVDSDFCRVNESWPFVAGDSTAVPSSGQLSISIEAAIMPYGQVWKGLGGEVMYCHGAPIETILRKQQHR